MPFLLGMCGPFLQSSQKNHLATIAKNHCKAETFQAITINNGIICTGKFPDELDSSDSVTPLPHNQGFFVGKLFVTTQ